MKNRVAEPTAGPSTAGPSTVKRPAGTPNSSGQGSGGGPPKQKRRKNDGKVKIEVTEAQMHGPFNFAAHRPEATAAAGSVASPPLVDLGRTPSPPPLVEIPENAAEDRRELLSSLTAMFPDTPREYLEEQASWDSNEV